MKAKKLALSKFDFERGISAEFRYTVSRGAETYGYNICTLYINGEKVSSCNGGGYDMRGTALGDWIEVQWPDELKTLEARWTQGEQIIPCPGCGGDKARTPKCGTCYGRLYYNPHYKKGGLYGLFFRREGKAYGSVRKWKEGDRVSLDGGCGISCMQNVLKSIGYAMRWIPTRKKNDDLYMIEPVQVTK